MLGGKNSTQDPLLLKLLFVGLRAMSPSITVKHPACYDIHCNAPKINAENL